MTCNLRSTAVFRVAAFTGLLAVAAMQSGGAEAAKTCGPKWAIPGLYTITGNFRGTPESAGARLTRSCKVFLRIPGVASGQRVRRAGRCLSFGFKVQGFKRPFRARWCNNRVSVPWKGRNVSASVRQVKKQRGFNQN